MQNFDYQTPTRLIFGRGVVEKLPKVMAPLGKRVLMTYGGGSIKKLGLYDRVKELLKDFTIVELPGIEPNRSISSSRTASRSFSVSMQAIRLYISS